MQSWLKLKERTKKEIKSLPSPTKITSPATSAPKLIDSPKSTKLPQTSSCTVPPSLLTGYFDTYFRPSKTSQSSTTSSQPSSLSRVNTSLYHSELDSLHRCLHQLSWPIPSSVPDKTCLKTKYSQPGSKKTESSTLTVSSLNSTTIATTSPASGTQQCKNMFKHEALNQQSRKSFPISLLVLPTNHTTQLLNTTTTENHISNDYSR